MKNMIAILSVMTISVAALADSKYKFDVYAVRLLNSVSECQSQFDSLMTKGQTVLSAETSEVTVEEGTVRTLEVIIGRNLPAPAFKQIPESQLTIVKRSPKETIVAPDQGPQWTTECITNKINN